MKVEVLIDTPGKTRGERTKCFNFSVGNTMFKNCKVGIRTNL